MPTEKVRHELRLGPELWERLRRRAFADEVSQNSVLEMALWEYLGKPTEARPEPVWRPRQRRPGE